MCTIDVNSLIAIGQSGKARLRSDRTTTTHVTKLDYSTDLEGHVSGSAVIQVRGVEQAIGVHSLVKDWESV